MSPDCQLASQGDRARPECVEETVRSVTKPEMPLTETVRRVEFVYEIQSSLPAGRLIDILL